MTSSNRERQSAEVVLLESMYPSEFSWRSDRELSLGDDESSAEPSFTLQLHPSYTLELVLPQDYPSSTKPSVYLSCAGDVPTTTRKQARAALDDIVTTLEPGTEVLDLLVSDFAALLPDLTRPASRTSNHDSAPTDPSTSTTSSSKSAGAKPKIKRVVIWSHHLLATSKRRDILSWSRELDLCGYSRPGYPGAVFAEGDEDAVDDFVQRLKALRWQALQVRAEETGETRLLAGLARGGGASGVEEVEGLGEIVEALRKRDEACAKLFLDGMKIAKGE